MTHAESRERNQQIINEYLSGISKPELAKKYNLSLITAQQILAGIKREPPTEGDEQWKKIDKYDYLISNFGRVWSLKSGSLISMRQDTGQLRVKLDGEIRGMFSVAHLVYRHFKVNKRYLRLIHRDGDINNCALYNLVEKEKYIPPPKERRVKVKQVKEKYMDSIILPSEAKIPYADNCTVRPRTYREHFSQVIWR